MKLFACQACSQSLYFESEHCERCDRKLGYLPEHAEITALEPVGEAPYRLYEDGEATYRFCANHTHDVCNWLIREDSQETFCAACRFNRTIPDLSNPRNLHLYRIIENGKHRLVYSMMRLRLPLVSKSDDEETGLAFDFLADENDEDRVLTGHADGVITLNIAEADSAERERTRQNMREPYRTVLGHFRHEIAHYYWKVLVEKGEQLEQVRDLFGDDRKDYGQALQTYYDRGAPEDWQEHFVSVYASCHPWEDWAETWAHYLHLVDTLETAHAFDLRVRPKNAADDTMKASVKFDPYGEPSFDRLINTWLPVSFAVNSLNRSMGNADLYPFILSPRVMDKLKLIHRIIRTNALMNT